MAKGFRIAARALRQLGAELITSDDIALNELIKNAFDAGSKKVEINIHSPFKIFSDILISNADKWPKTPIDAIPKLKSSLIDSLKNELITEIVESFLDNSENNSVDALKSVIDEYCYIHVSDTGCGMDVADLEDVFMVIGTPTKWISKQNKSDSIVLGEKGIGRLSMMRLGSTAFVESGKNGEKFWHNVEFDWSDFDDPNTFLDDITITVEAKGDRKDINEKGTDIFIHGLHSHWTNKKTVDFVHQYLRRLQNPFDTKIKRYRVDVNFNGERIHIPPMPAWLKKSAHFSASFEYNPYVVNLNDIVLTRKVKWQENETHEICHWTLAEILERIESCTHNELRDIGKFKLDLLWFNRGNLKIHDIDLNITEFKKELNLWCGGYAIYRDGFRIGMTGSMEDDWLKMDSKALKSQGFTFNRYQTVGALSITPSENKCFVDSANRESLIDCPSFDLLKDLFTEVINSDLKSHISTVKEVETKIEISKETTADAIGQSKIHLKKTIVAVNKLKPFVEKNHKNDLVEIGNSIKTHLEDVKKLEKAVTLARDQRIELLELANLGMVFDKVVHELARLTAKAADNLEKLESTEASKESAEIIKALKEQITATNKRIRTADELSPSGRNRKGKFNITALIRTILSGYSGRFNRHNIRAEILIDGETSEQPIEVNMVRGLISQILENLLENSLYWLKRGLRSGDTKRVISIEIDTQSKVITYSDNGPGIEPTHKISVFNPYFTRKHQGKGLGLFISKELADYHKVDFYLDGSPEIDGRLRTFILELPKGA